MVSLPDRFLVHLKDRRGRPLAAPDVLIGINFLVHGRYYYGNLIGLTDERGTAAISGAELHRRFQQDRANFPMDYKVDLDASDRVIEIVLLTGEEIAEARRGIADNFLIAPDIRDAYGRARNEHFTPASSRVSITGAPGDVVVTLVTDRQGG